MRVLRYLILAVVVPAAVLVEECHGQTVRWNFQRQVVDQQGAPITNATVEVSGSGRTLTRLYAQSDRILRTDKNGSFAIDMRAQSLYVTITNNGFVRKRLNLDPVMVDPKGFPASGKIVLTRAKPLPRPDRLDKIETQIVDINDFKQGSAVWMSFRPGRVQAVADKKTLIQVERSTNGFRITCQPGTQGKALDYEPGLWAASWLSSNAFADDRGMTTDFLCPTHPQPSYGNDTAAFVLKTRGYWVIATLSVASWIRTEDFAVWYNLSADNIFVNESRDTDSEP